LRSGLSLLHPDKESKRGDRVHPSALNLQASGGRWAIRLFGVPVRFHFTFVLLLIYLLVMELGSPQTGLLQIAFFVAVFGSVLLHELGHALAARHYGIGTVEIVMFPIGGVARLERSPRPAEELWIALAGPLVNLAIFALLFGYFAWFNRVMPNLSSWVPGESTWLQRVATVNLLLLIFNLIPAFPMDGGRILRSLLARFRGENEATRLAAAAGRLLAISMGLYGLLSAQFLLVFIAFFVYLGAAQESAAALGRVLTQGIPVRAAMVTKFHTIEHGQTVRDAANLLLATSQQDFPVMHGGEVVGLLGRHQLMRALAVEGPDAYVAGAMNRDFVRLDPQMDLAEALPVMAEAGPCALVMDGAELRGLLTTENLSEFLLLRRIGIEPAAAQ
jgi:stage IV sporulation protein FB